MANCDEFNEEISSILSFEEEKDDGDTEYKRMLVGKSPLRLEELQTQMRYRMEQGSGQCTYIIGVDDDGSLFGLTEEECEETHQTLLKLAKKNDYSIRLLVESTVKRKDKSLGKIREYLIRENNTADYEEIKIATGGNVDSGKSSTIGTLISGNLDNGNGSSRVEVLNFKHEIESGRTSSISQQILGYDPDGNVVNHDLSVKKIVSWPEISSRSSKIIKFYDLCGHSKYSKTTLRGIIGNSVDYVFITVGSNMGIKGTTREHIGICLTLQIPVIILLTKIDLGEKVPKVMEDTISQIKNIFSQSGSRRLLYAVNDINDVITVSKNIQHGNIVPMFKTSNVRGDGLKLVHEFLNIIRPRLFFDKTQDVEMHVDETFLPKGIGLVVGGFLKKGTLRTGKEYYIGPINDEYKKIKCRSLHVNRTSVQEALPGRYVCVNIPKLERSCIKKGMVILGNKESCLFVETFKAEVVVYRTHHTTIRIGYETMIHINSLRVTVKLINIIEKKKIKLKKSVEKLLEDDFSENVLSLGDRAIIQLKFTHKPNYINIGDKFMLAESRVKMSGRVTNLK